MQLHDRIHLGKEAAVLGSRYIAQTDDDQKVFRILTTCGENLLFEVSDGESYLIASDGTIEELEEYALSLAEDGAEDGGLGAEDGGLGAED
ncbi:MAG TPA: hypothetical protein PLB32_19845, partial [Acidobacteriota bacterium]|nr:hypothetical protein [Acidobacteriota bacterium]